MNQAEPGFGFDRAICHETHAIILSVCKSGGLAAAMVGIGFLDPDAEGLHQGEIVERKEEGFFGPVEIDMHVHHPRGPAENVQPPHGEKQAAAAVTPEGTSEIINDLDGMRK